MCTKKDVFLIFGHYYYCKYRTEDSTDINTTTVVFPLRVSGQDAKVQVHIPAMCDA